MNIAILIGRLTADPELRSTKNGTSVVTFTVAVDRGYSKKENEKQTDFINCVAFRETANHISRWFGKGRMIAVEGSIQTRSYEDKQGNKRTATELIVSKAHFTGEKKQDSQQTYQDNGYQSSGYQDNTYQQPAQSDYISDPNVISDDVIPF